MKTSLLIIALLSVSLISALPPEDDPPILSPTATPQEDVIFVSVMADGRIIDVRQRTLCQDATVYGSPTESGIVRYSLPKGSVITTHELHGDWAMFKPAHWIPITSLCRQ